MSVFNRNTRRVLSYDVLRQQKTRKRGYDQGCCVRGRGGCLTSSPAYKVEPVTNTSSSSCVQTTDDGRRGVLDARRRPSRLYYSHFTTRTVDNSVDLYAAKPDIRPESRVLPTPPAFDAPVRGVPVGISPACLVWKN